MKGQCENRPVSDAVDAHIKNITSRQAGDLSITLYDTTEKCRTEVDRRDDDDDDDDERDGEITCKSNM